MSTYKRHVTKYVRLKITYVTQLCYFKIYMYFISDNVRFSIENIPTDNNPGEGSRKIRKLRSLFLSLISVSTRVAVERTPLICDYY